MLDDPGHEKFGAKTSFLMVRIGEARRRHRAKKNPKKSDGDKTLKYHHCAPDVQAELRKARASEWRNGCHSTQPSF